jgi:uncharacterized membrane protein
MNALAYPSRLMFSLAVLGLAVLGLVYRDFAVIWQPVPAGLPWHEALALLSAAVMLACALGLLFERTAALGALALAACLLISWVLPQAVKEVPAGTGFVGRWLGFFETLAPVCGCLALLAARGWPGLQADKLTLAARGVFGLACLVFGYSHFMYPVFTAAMIPDWIPGRLALAYLTGAGHVAAGLALLAGVLPRLAASLEALMMSGFVLLVHVPAVVIQPAPEWAPTGRIQWTALFWASTMAGGAWLIARALRGPTAARP